ncbi:MAG: flagellar hook-basal body protein [Helicobacteraceae bacterium]|jgi:flagellar basal-body rod protein FlgG|nr:flagellar hook-basal body protein [Helicobacteraceae bacterium]
MQTGFYSNTGGMVTQFNRLDVISNNLANINTAGFKRDDVVIGDFMRLYKETHDELPLRNHTRAASQHLNRAMVRVPQVVEEYTDFDLGNLMQTGGPLDVALQAPNLFFAVETPNGARYTRDGSFKLSENGTLVSKEGFAVLNSGNGEIALPSDRHIAITSEGVIYAQNRENLTEQEEIARLKIVRFENQKWLEKVGDNYYKIKEPSGTAGNQRQWTQEIEAEGQFLVAQGFIEKSNINAVSEMTALIETNRLVGMYQKVMDTHMNEINGDAINKLAVIKA